MGTQTVLVHLRERPARKLILTRGRTCADYFAFCEEVGCDTWGQLCAIADALYEPVGLWMPPNYRPAGTSFYVQGVEVPTEYAAAVPDGFEVIDLPAGLYLFFQGEPYLESMDEMNAAIGRVQETMLAFDPRPYGYAWADEDAPRVQLAPQGARGYIEGRPVSRLPATGQRRAF